MDIELVQRFDEVDWSPLDEPLDARGFGLLLGLTVLVPVVALIVGVVL